MEEKYDHDEKELIEIKEAIINLTKSLPGLNKFVCGGDDYPCDKICGGAMCGHCGDSISCDSGSKQQAETAKDLSLQTESTLKEIEDRANDFIRNVTTINTTLSKDLAQEAFEKAKNSFVEANTTWEQVNQVKRNITAFLQQNISSINDINKLMDEVNNLLYYN